jgi:lysozyme family protein
MSSSANRLRMAVKILDFEARRDSRGRLKVYHLPPGDGGGTYEVGGINERYHPAQAARLRELVEAGQYDDAENYACSYIANYTDAADRWTPHDAVESYLRDCIFNRGAGGAAAIYQMALGVRVDGDVGPHTLAAGERVPPASCLRQMRTARERYERRRRDESSPFWRGLVNRWNNALVFAQNFLPPGSEAATESSEESDREARPGEFAGSDLPAARAQGEANRETTPETEEGAGLADEQDAEMPPEAGARDAEEDTRAGELDIRPLRQPLASRRRSAQPTLIVLHATAGASAQSSIDYLRTKGFSYHYIIARDGRDAARARTADGSVPIVFQCVADERVAFHVGSTIPAPSGEGSINQCSIGLSLANIQNGSEPYTARQMTTLHALIRRLKQAHPTLRWLTNHALVQPWNRSDPLHVDAAEMARVHGFELFRPTAQQIRDHRR